VRGILAPPPKVFLSEEQSREVKAVLAKAEASLVNLEVRV
jgi:hypothetical protein